MDFGANKTPVEITKEGAFGGTYFRDIYSTVNGKWYRKSSKEFDEQRDIDQSITAQIIDVSANKYCIKCGTTLRLWENKGWIDRTDPYGWFQWYFRYWLGRSSDDERQINRWKQIAIRWKQIVSISTKIRQILLHWGYELTEKEFF